MVVYDVYGTCHQAESAQFARSRVLVFCDVARPTGDPRIHHRIRHDRKSQGFGTFLRWIA